MRKTFAIVVLAAAVAAAQAPPAGLDQRSNSRQAANTPHAPSYKALQFPPLKPIQIPNVDTVTLPNGIRLYLLEDHELPLINGTARVRTGNLFDPPDKIGLATMTGMVMRTGGTQSKTGEQLDLALENVAASVESSIEETLGRVSFSALKENADQVLGIFKDVMTAPEFRQDKIDLAKGQLRSGIARRNDDAHGIAEREFADTVYGKDNPYGWRMEYETIDRITRDDLQGFYKRYFFPANVMLAVWGDFNTAEMKAKLEKLFSDWTVQQSPVPAFSKVRGAPAPGIYLAVKQDVTQTFFAMGHLGGEFRDKDYPALEIMSDILGGGFRSRLFQRVRTKMGNAYEIESNWGANYDHPGLFEIAGSTKSPSTVETIRAIREEVDRIRTSEVGEDELKTARDAALFSLVFAFDTKAKTLGRVLTYEYYGYPKDFIQQYQKALTLVTRADVLRAAKERLNPDIFAVVTVGNPAEFGQKLESLGPVHQVDLTIPEPRREQPKASAASQETGKRLLARAQEAVGGAGALAAVKDYTESADFQLDASAGGVRLKQTERWIAPDDLRQDSELPNGKISAFFDGRSGWMVSPQGRQPLAGPELKQVQGDLFRIYFRLLLSDRIEGRTVNAIDDHTVEVGDSAGEHARLAFDPATGLPQRLSYDSTGINGSPSLVEESYSDFREIAGVKVPYKITIQEGGRKFADVTVTDYKVNSGLKPEELEKQP